VCPVLHRASLRRQNLESDRQSSAMVKREVTPLVDAKGVREVRLLRRRPRYVVQGVPVEVAGIPFALTYAGIAMHVIFLAFAGEWCVLRRICILPVACRRQWHEHVLQCTTYSARAMQSPRTSVLAWCCVTCSYDLCSYDLSAATETATCSPACAAAAGTQ